jgi:(1->4)-alpha-D-glucan 1-alpha-D-glucosylmutase
VLDDHAKNRFLVDFRGFHEQIVIWGLANALSQTLLKLTAPGVPDVYQGQELWDFSLVDPDNRRPVDFAQRRKMLARLRKDAGRNERSLFPLSRKLAQNPRDPRLKLFVTWRVLQFRRQHADLFRLGDCIPLDVEGARAKHLCVFARRWLAPAASEPRIAVVIAPRMLAQLTALSPESPAVPPPLDSANWEDTRICVESLAASPLRNVFTGQICSAEDARLSVAAALGDFPVALLTNLARVGSGT